MSKITYNQISELTGKPYRTIKRHFDMIGVEPVSRTGNKVYFESSKALQLKSAKVSKGDEDYTQLLEEEKHRKLKRENDLAEEEVAPVTLLTDALEKVAAQIVPIMDSLPLEMKRMNPKLSGHDIMLVKKCIARSRNAIADAKIDLE